jgi:putative transposase
VLGVHRSLFYYHKKRLSTVNRERESLRVRMKELHQANRGSAGARTLSALMCREGKAVGRYKAGQLMKEAGLVSRQPGNHRYRVCDRASLLADNRLNRCFTVEEPDRVWCGDITFIRTGTGWVYLAVVLDLYARKVVGWALSAKADSQLAQDALTMAWHGRGRPAGILFHSDQGTQYSSVSYRAMSGRYGMKRSMSRRGNCWDNAVTERLFRSLKTEWVPRRGYRNAEEAEKDVSFYLSGYYNRIRPHRHNSELSPAEKENLLRTEPLTVS